ncbi:hypothetical protein AVEN_239344-1 [Araneus ventricosus]|uniref:Uncharacterized protein n=1 Tax=Araneus ventricosus TaxID=182803 RepID=A0A4Y2EBP4_ARAVE|nr:hypothetical protein AVEN_239344-1 [Araneus ventricosus]
MQSGRGFNGVGTPFSDCLQLAIWEVQSTFSWEVGGCLSGPHNVKDAERFYLRMLLLHVPGAGSFKFLRTVDNVIYDTFKEAAFHRHLLNSDEEWDHCLHDTSTYQIPKQQSQTFAFILCFCNPTNVLELWNKYSIDMPLDNLRNNIEAASWNLALHDINATLEQRRSVFPYQLEIPLKYNPAIKMKKERKPNKEYHP